jgi:hypothetical protein
MRFPEAAFFSAAGAAVSSSDKTRRPSCQFHAALEQPQALLQRLLAVLQLLHDLLKLGQ